LEHDIAEPFRDAFRTNLYGYARYDAVAGEGEGLGRCGADGQEKQGKRQYMASTSPNMRFHPDPSYRNRS